MQVAKKCRLLQNLNSPCFCLGSRNPLLFPKLSEVKLPGRPLFTANALGEVVDNTFHVQDPDKHSQEAGVVFLAGDVVVLHDLHSILHDNRVLH